jgi:hypothetical protein
MQGDEIGGECGRCGCEGKCRQGLVGKLERYRPLENLGMNGRIIFKWILNVLEDVEWIILAQDSDKWRAVVSTVMNICVL